MKHSQRLLNILLYLALVGVGLVAGIAIRHYNHLPLSETINIIDIATLVTTVFLAVYIPEVLDRKLQTTRDKKELLEKRILEYQGLLRRVNMLVQGETAMTQDEFLAMQNSLDVADGKLDSVSRLLQYSKLGDTFPREMAAIKKMGREHRELLIPSGGDSSVPAYTAAIREKEADLYDRIDEATAMLIFKISDAK